MFPNNIDKFMGKEEKKKKKSHPPIGSARHATNLSSTNGSALFSIQKICKSPLLNHRAYFLWFFFFLTHFLTLSKSEYEPCGMTFMSKCAFYPVNVKNEYKRLRENSRRNVIIAIKWTQYRGV